MKKSWIEKKIIRITGKLKGIGKEKVALASYPRSGNTWIRILLEEYTGLESGSIYNDRFFFRSPYGIVIKTHSKDDKPFEKAIVLIRHPYHSIPSHYTWCENYKSNFDQSWEAFYFNQLKDWYNHVSFWKSSNKKTLFVKYEELIENPKMAFSEILTFLNQEIIDEKITSSIKKISIERLRKNGNDNDGKFFANKNKNKITSEQKELTKKTIPKGFIKGYQY